MKFTRNSARRAGSRLARQVSSSCEAQARQAGVVHRGSVLEKSTGASRQGAQGSAGLHEAASPRHRSHWVNDGRMGRPPPDGTMDQLPRRWQARIPLASSGGTVGSPRML